MSLYTKLARKPKQFLTLTGVELSDFEQLLPELGRHAQQQEQQRKSLVVRTKQPRQRQPGGGASYANDLPNQVHSFADIATADADILCLHIYPYTPQWLNCPGRILLVLIRPIADSFKDVFRDSAFMEKTKPAHHF